MKKLKELFVEVLRGRLCVEIFAETDGSYSATISGELTSPAQHIEPGEPIPNMKHSSYGPVKLSSNSEKEIASAIESRIKSDLGRIIRIESRN
jgi:hypothetical protein